MKKTKREKINLDITKPLVAWTTITAEMGKETVNIDPQVKQAPAQLALPAVERRDNALRTPAKVTKLVMGPIGGRMKQDDATKQKDDSHRTLDPTQIPKGKDNADNSLVDTPENTASVMHKTRASAGPKVLRQGGKGKPTRKPNQENVFTSREPRRGLDLCGQDISSGKDDNGRMDDSVVWTKEELKEEEYGIA
jgi:hypothetical protein